MSRGSRRRQRGLISTTHQVNRRVGVRNSTRFVPVTFRPPQNRLLAPIRRPVAFVRRQAAIARKPAGVRARERGAQSLSFVKRHVPVVRDYTRLERAVICAARFVRRQVLIANKKHGSGGGSSPKRYDETSRVRC